MLTHVSTWKNGRWERISAEEAAKLYPFTVPVGQKRFICDLCGQYVTFTGPGKVNRHFKHNRGDDDKTCEERSSYYAITALTDSEKALAIRINVSHDQCYFSIGLPAVPESLLDLNIDETIIIHYGMGKSKYYSLERLSPYFVTYLPLDGRLYENYSIEFSDERLKTVLGWPLCAIGYSGSGRLFDKKSGKLLPFDCDVTVGNSYYYVTKKRLLQRETPYVRKLMNMAGGCYLYELAPTKLDQVNAEFFLELKARLTDAPHKSSIMWPPCRMADQLVYHHDRAALLMVNGNVKTSADNRVLGPILRNRDWALYRIQVDEERRSVLMGRTKLLGYWEFIHSDKRFMPEVPDLEICDEDGKYLERDTYTKLPKEKKLYITAEYDGFVFITWNDGNCTRKELPAEEKVEISGIKEGTIVGVYIGNSLLREIEFWRQEKRSARPYDMYQLLIKTKGRRIPISQASIGAFASAYPDKKVRAWLRKLNGTIPVDAMELLRKNMNSKEMRYDRNHCE